MFVCTAKRIETSKLKLDRIGLKYKLWEAIPTILFGILHFDPVSGRDVGQSLLEKAQRNPRTITDLRNVRNINVLISISVSRNTLEVFNDM